MVNNPEKATRYARELDEARLNGQFQLVPNLARKLQKHDDQKECLAKAAVCEKELNDLVASLEKETPSTKADQYGLSLPAVVTPESQQEIVKNMSEALESTGSIEDKQLAQVIASQMWITMGQWKKAIERTEMFTGGTAMRDVHGYAYVLVLKAYYFNALAHEGLEDVNSALEKYINAFDFIQHSHPENPYYSVQYWINKIMYGLCMLALGHKEPNESIKYFRQFRQLVDINAKIDFSFRERLDIYYWYWRLLSRLVKEQGDEKDISTRVDGEKEPSTPTKLQSYEVRKELLDIQNLYESALFDATKFPRAGSTNEKLLQFVDGAVENWRLLGSDPTVAKNLVQILYRATTKTFQSPRIMRHLMYALEGSGESAEAERSLDAYLWIVDNEKKTLATSLHSAVKNPEHEGLVEDIETDDEICRTMAAGIRLLVKYRKEGKKAFDMARSLEQRIQIWNINDPEILSSVWYAVGLANSLWATQTTDAKSRQAVHASAIRAFNNALSQGPERLEAYYQLALEHARQRNLENSISALSHALRIDKQHVPSIHLLALVLTALEDYEKALQTCHTIKLDNIEHLDLEAAVGVIELQLTYLRIVEQVSGYELALEVQKGVFKLYNRIFGPVKRYAASINDNPTFHRVLDPPLRRTRSNINEKRAVNAQSSLSKVSVESSKLSIFHVPLPRTGRPRSILRKRRGRARSADGRSVVSEVSDKNSERTPQSGGSSEGFSHQILGSAPSTPPQTSHEKPTSPTVSHFAGNGLETLPKFASSSVEERDKVARECRAKLWLACVGIYRRAHQWDAALTAIQDALLCDIIHEDIYTELGTLNLDRGHHSEAIANFQRALLYVAEYPPAIVGLAEAILTQPEDKDIASSQHRAEVLLDSVTRLGGWDSSAAWFWLGEVYERYSMPVKAAECWTYCEDLEERKPIREWLCVRPQWL